MRDKHLNVAVLYGGSSSEREISLVSGRAVGKALQETGYRVSMMDVRDDYLSLLKSQAIDIAFIALHGKFGEDGTLQSILDREGILYTGSGPEGCCKAMNKEETRRILSEAGLPEPTWWVISSLEEATRLRLTYPLFVKPVRGGSSIGVCCVKGREDLENALQIAFKEDDRVLIETEICGREIAVGILGDRALSPIEITTPRDYYDFVAKYQDDKTEYIFPRDLSVKDHEMIRACALKAHHSIGCEVFSRVDILWNGRQPYVLEVNAIPGLTPKSLLPKQAKAEGLDFNALCIKIIEESIALRKGVLSGQKKN